LPQEQIVQNAARLHGIINFAAILVPILSILKKRQEKSQTVSVSVTFETYIWKKVGQNLKSAFQNSKSAVAWLRHQPILRVPCAIQ
jgi:hypothetical protein